MEKLILLEDENGKFIKHYGNRIVINDNRKTVTVGGIEYEIVSGFTKEQMEQSTKEIREAHDKIKEKVLELFKLTRKKRVNKRIEPKYDLIKNQLLEEFTASDVIWSYEDALRYIPVYLSERARLKLLDYLNVYFDLVQTHEMLPIRVRHFLQFIDEILSI